MRGFGDGEFRALEADWYLGEVEIAELECTSQPKLAINVAQRREATYILSDLLRLEVECMGYRLFLV